MIRGTFITATAIILASATVLAHGPAPGTPRAAPHVTAPTAPAITAPTVAPPSGPTAAFTTSPQKAANIAVAYDETAFKHASASGGSVLILFSGAADTIWQKQAPVMQQILREPEFKNLPAFQVDATNAELMGRFSVTVPGTLLVMKGGVERIRSTRMVKPDVIRKMLRLHTAL